MQVPVQIVFERMEPSDAVRARVEKEVEKLESFHDRITSCHVAVIAPGHHRHHGGLFDVRIRIATPGRKEIVVDRSPPADHAHEDPYVALRDAFRAVRRRLQDSVRRQQGKVKRHETPPHGRVVKLFPDEGYGFIESAEGEEIYFHRNSVIEGGFERLAIGSEVRFAAQSGAKGLQASTVHPVGKHKPV